MLDLRAAGSYLLGAFSRGSMTDSANSKLTATLIHGLEWLYDRAIKGVPTLDSASDLAISYQCRFPSSDKAVDALIKWQTAKAGTASFVSSFGGVLSLPVALPANLASVTYIQLRMIAAIAHLRGHDIRSDQVRTVALACLGGARVADMVKEFGVRFGTQLAHEALKRVSGDGLKQINQAIACRLVAVTGTATPISFSKFVPVIGGVVAGGIDAAVTRAYGHTAKRLFQPIAAY
jgi:uncharacterized protein (DUF697 family)